MAYKPKGDSSVEKYCNNLVGTYIKEDALFELNLWAEPSAEMNRTTNGVNLFKINLMVFSIHHILLYMFSWTLSQKLRVMCTLKCRV